jgi:hypothetical protein
MHLLGPVLIVLAGLDPSGLAACRAMLEHVHDDGVDYRGLASDPKRPECEHELADARPDRLPKREALAFWINAYNLATLTLVAANASRWSVRQDGRAVFADERARVAGQRLTPDDIEHEKIARLSSDPRIEFVLSCATRGCGLLPRELVSARNLDRLLDEGESRFFARPWNLEVDRHGRRVWTSQLLAPDWAGGAFLRSGQPIEQVVARHLPEPDARALREGRLRLGFRPYDWRLNRLREGYGLP